MLPTPKFNEHDFSDLTDLGRALKEAINRPTSNKTEELLRGNKVELFLIKNQLEEKTIKNMERYGLVCFDGKYLQSPYKAHIVEDKIFFTDPFIKNWEKEEYYLDCLWEAPHLVNLLVRDKANKALDIGCGCGIFSLIAASYAQQVIGVDINPRALQISRFNAAINGVKNVIFKESDLFQSVKGQKYDHIIFNSPTNFELKQLCLLQAGEKILERFFSQLPRFLDKNGRAQVNMAIVDRRKSLFWNRLASWLSEYADRSQILFLEKFRLETGLRFFLNRLLDCLRYRQNAYDVTGNARGWLTLKWGSPFAIRIPTPYHQWAGILGPEFGSVLMSRLLSFGGDLVERKNGLEQEIFIEEPNPVSITPAEHRQLASEVVRECLQKAESLPFALSPK